MTTSSPMISFAGIAVVAFVLLLIVIGIVVAAVIAIGTNQRRRDE